AAEHADLCAELAGDERQLLDRLVRRVYRDDRGWGELVAEALEVLVRDDVVPTDHGAPGGVVRDAADAEPGGRVDDTEIDAELVQPVVQHPGHHRRSPVPG